MTQIEQLLKDIEYMEFCIDTERYYTFTKCHRLLNMYRNALKEYSELLKNTGGI